jgi:hypothetical protein
LASAPDAWSLPSLQRLPVLPLAAAEQVGVSADHLPLQTANDRRTRESPGFLGQDDLERDVQQQVTQLALEPCRVTGPNGVHDFVALLQQMGDERPRRLSLIPGAVSSEEAHQGHAPVQGPRGRPVFGLEGKQAVVVSVGHLRFSGRRFQGTAGRPRQRESHLPSGLIAGC